MGCTSSKADDSLILEPFSEKPLESWTAEEVQRTVSQNSALQRYASTLLKGTAGAVFAHMDNQILQEAGMDNGLHRLQLLHLRDEILERQNSKSTASEFTSETESPRTPVQTPTRIDYQSLQPSLTARKKKTIQSVDVEGGRYMAMMKVSSTGTLHEVLGETLPLISNRIARSVVELQKLHCAAHYNTDNCRKFVKRCCQIQTIFESKHLKACVNNIAIIQLIDEVLQEAILFFSVFSQRGWLKRTLQNPRDRKTFEELDKQLIHPCTSSSFLNLSSSSITNLQEMPIYANSTKQLSKALLDVAGMEGLRQCPSAVEQIKEHFPKEKRNELDDCIREDILEYEMQIDANGPHTILRQHTLKVFWKRYYSQKERITWDEFWNTFPRMFSSSLYALSQLLSLLEDVFVIRDVHQKLTEALKRPQNRELLQTHLTRTLPQLLSVTELDFAFPLDARVEETLQRIVSRTSRSATAKSDRASIVTFCEGVIDRGHAFNFPTIREDVMERAELFMQVVFGVQHPKTKIAEINGRPGIGKSVFANQLGRHLLSTGYWTEAYWIDLTGISSHTAAGHQFMHGVGIEREIVDVAIPPGLLQQRHGIIGVVIVGLDALLRCRDDATRLLDYLERLIHAADRLQIIIVTNRELQDSREGFVQYQLESFSIAQCSTWVLERLEAHLTDASITQGMTHPLCLDMLCSAIEMGSFVPEQFSTAIDHELISSYADQIHGHQPLMSLEKKELKCTIYNGISVHLHVWIVRCLLVCLWGLEASLFNCACTLSICQGPFTEDFAFALLQSSGELPLIIRSNLRKLQRRRILTRNEALGKLSIHVLIRSALQFISAQIGLDQRQAIRAYIQAAYEQVIWTAQQMMHKGTCTVVAIHAIHRDAVHIYQLMNWAISDIASENQDIYQKIVWEAFPHIARHLDPYALQKFYEACSAIAEKSKNIQFRVHCMIQSGEMLRIVGRLQDSENMLRHALGECLTHLNEESLETARCYEGIGVSCAELRKIRDAIPVYERAIELYKRLLGDKSIQVAQCSQQLGSVYALAKRYEDAYGCCMEALEIRKHVHSPKHVLVASAMTSVGTQLNHLNKSREAEDIHSREALEMVEGLLGAEHPEIAEILIKFAEVLRSMKKRASAESILLRALQIRESSCGMLHVDTSTCIRELATLYKGMRRFDDAALFAARDFETCKERGDSDIEQAAAMMTLSGILRCTADYHNAYKHCKRALHIRERQLGSTDLSVASSCFLLGVILQHRGKYNEAKAMVVRSLEIRQKRFAENLHPDIASSLNALAEIERDLNAFDLAEERCRRGMAIRTKLYPDNHLSISVSLQTLASILAETDRIDEAEVHIQRSLEIREKHHGTDDFPLMAGYDILAMIYCKKGQFDEAEEKAHTAVAVKSKTLSTHHPEVAHSLLGTSQLDHSAQEAVEALVLGKVLLCQCRHGAARQKIQRAKSIYKRVFAEEHPLVNSANNLLTDINH